MEYFSLRDSKRENILALFERLIVEDYAMLGFEEDYSPESKFITRKNFMSVNRHKREVVFYNNSKGEEKQINADTINKFPTKKSTSFVPMTVERLIQSMARMDRFKGSNIRYEKDIETIYIDERPYVVTETTSKFTLGLISKKTPLLWISKFEDTTIEKFESDFSEFEAEVNIFIRQITEQYLIAERWKNTLAHLSEMYKKRNISESGEVMGSMGKLFMPDISERDKVSISLLVNIHEHYSNINDVLIDLKKLVKFVDQHKVELQQGLDEATAIVNKYRDYDH